MLKKQMEQYMIDNARNGSIELFGVEKDYAEKHQLLSTDIEVSAKDFQSRLIERCNKETEDVIQTEGLGFLKEKVSFLKNQQEEFVYTEADDFQLIGVDAVALEFDDVFETYTALFGLKLQKKFGPAIKAYLDAYLQGDGVKYSVMFSGEDGLWDMNFALDFIEGFSEELTFEEVYGLIYQFVFKLNDSIEEAQ